MKRIKCQVRGCENKAFMLYGNKWICGKCFMKIQTKQLEQKNKLIEEIGND